MPNRDIPLVEVRAAVPGDAPAIARIWREGWSDGHLGHVPGELVAARTPESFRARAGERITDTLVATIAGGVVGFTMVVRDEIEQIYVDREHRGTGVASSVVAEAEQRVQAHGYAVAWLAVVPGNVRARRFYERLGWQDDGPFEYSAQTDTGAITVPCRRYVKRVAARG